MEFTIPQFIEKEPKIVGPLTFKQFIFVGFAGVLCFVFYYTLPFGIFLLLSAAVLGVGISLAFLKINGAPLPVVIKNMFYFVFKPRIYLWKKGSFQEQVSLKREKKPQTQADKKNKGPIYKVSTKSQLGNLYTKIETKK